MTNGVVRHEAPARDPFWEESPGVPLPRRTRPPAAATVLPAVREENAGGLEDRLDRELRRHSDFDGQRQERLRSELLARVREEGESHRRLDE